MTHSLHRRGSVDSLKNDYVLLVTPAIGINDKNSKEKLQKILDVIWEVGPTNIGSYESGTVFSGSTISEIKERLCEKPRVRCVFSDRKKIEEVVRKIRDMDTGLSVTVSGLTSEIEEMCKELEIKPHSINLSLGVLGNTKVLPPEWVLEITTMCGHGMVSALLVEKLAKQIVAGRITPRQAAETLARPCLCGIFNVDRAEAILTENLIDAKKETEAGPGGVSF